MEEVCHQTISLKLNRFKKIHKIRRKIPGVGSEQAGKFDHVYAKL